MSDLVEATGCCECGHKFIESYRPRPHSLFWSEVTCPSCGHVFIVTLPSTDFIKALVDRGVDIITVGSDAHTPNDVGADIERAMTLLGDRCGVIPTRFRNGKRVTNK